MVRVCESIITFHTAQCDLWLGSKCDKSLGILRWRVVVDDADVVVVLNNVDDHVKVVPCCACESEKH